MNKKVWLLVVAAPKEGRAVLRGLGGEEAWADQPWMVHPVGGFEVVVTGVGKVNAAGAVGRVLDSGRHGAVVSVGVAGDVGCGMSDVGCVLIGSVVAATESVYADEGLETPEGFVDCRAMGFPLGPWEGAGIPADADVLRVLRSLADVAGPVATVSTCSGTDVLARRVRERTGAIAEAMEGAAVAHVAARVGVPSGELRVISNTCGDRGKQVWDLRSALEKLEAVIGRLAGARGVRLGGR